MSIKFFGKIDHNKHGKIGSSVPAWAMQNHIENLEEEVSSKRRALERGEIPPDKVMEFRAEVEKESKRLADIKDSRPKLTDEEEKRVDEAYKYLGLAISESMFTRSDMHLGLADAHEEARRISKPCIKIPENVVAMCKENNINVTERKGEHLVTRKHAELLYKYCGHYKNDNTNTEFLRRDKGTARTATVKPKYMEIIGG
jgi:hypothetical protein